MNNTFETNVDQPCRKRMAVGLFRSPCLAEEAVRELKKASFSPSEISVAIRDPKLLQDFTHQTGAQPLRGFPRQKVHENRIRSLLDWLTGIALIVIRCGLPEEQARHVEAEYRTGAFLIIIEDESRWAEASAILQLNGGETDFAQTIRSVPHHASFSSPLV